MTTKNDGSDASTPKSYVMEAECGRINFSPHGFRMWARHYYMCMKGFVAPDVFSPVPYFLLCRAIELSLKARLLESQSQLEVKNQFGHDLAKCYKGLPVVDQILMHEEIRLLETATLLYMKEMAFTYPSPYDAATAYTRFPDLGKLDALAAKLLA